MSCAPRPSYHPPLSSNNKKHSTILSTLQEKIPAEEMSSPIREVPENEPLLTSDGTPNDNETGSGQGPWVRQPLTRINKVIRVASVAVIATASANFALSVAVVVMLYYGISNFDRGDWEIEWAGPSFLWAVRVPPPCLLCSTPSAKLTFL